eukprot:10606943-Alexandrium_andersonii.AAC.1
MASMGQNEPAVLASLARRRKGGTTALRHRRDCRTARTGRGPSGRSASTRGGACRRAHGACD